MSMIEVYDMVKDLGYNSPQEIYWQSPGGVLSVNPLKTDSDVLSMLATMPRNKNVETELPIDAETVRNTESEDEDTDYVGSESEQSDSPFEDSDNDLVDDDLVCDVQVGVGRDIHGFRTCSSEDSDEGVDSEVETESLHSACDSETEVERNRFPEFNSVVDIENPKFKKGLLFSDQKIFKAALKQYAVKNRFNIRLKVNDSARVQAVCKDGCPWMVWASKMYPKDKTNKTWQIKTYVGEHKCVRDTKNRNCIFRWLAKEYLEKFRVEPNYSAKSLKHDVMKDHMILVQRSKCIRAKKLALEMILGNQDEQYARIYDYLGELRGTNPGTTTAIEYLEKFRVEPTYSAKSLKHDVMKDHMILVQRSKCIRAKKLALEMILGNQDEQYARIYDYLGELRGTNPGTTTVCHLDNRLFVRMYVCLKACKDGFRAGCRPLICLDGCFLKGHYQGWLLAAVGIDANDCIYPLAFAVVESETRDSWTWFLQILETDLELTNSFHYTFMSDKQKGLIDSILELFPNSNSRTCVRHLYNNFKLQSGNQGKALKDALWRAARATYMKEWTDAMHELKAMSEQSFNWLVAKDPRNWSKAHFSTNLKSDMLLNNLCESFNKMILESRDKPILTMMEMIRCKIMTRIPAKKEAAEKFIGTLCPKIQKKLDKILEQSIRCWPRNAGGQRWEVSAGFEDQHAVDLEAQTCSCRKWDLTGIPCIHVASVILHIGARPEDFVNPCY
ncbi:hypothetical protein V6N13_122392 [Hibiscus sabdariffa]